MSPYLSARGKAALGVALIWLLAGVVLLILDRDLAATLALFGAFSVLVSLSFFFLAAFPLVRALDSDLIVAIKPQRQQAYPLNQDAQLLVELINPTPMTLRRCRLWPELATPLTLGAKAQRRMSLRAQAEASVEWPITSIKTGRWFVQGVRLLCEDVSGFFYAKSYCPAPLALTYVPRVVGKWRRTTARAQRRRVSAGAHRARIKGSSSELRELREHQYGDSFRSIAWKASARLNRLMVREFESDLTLNASVLLDISSTMRSSKVERSKLEHALELALSFSAEVMSESDRCGLISFDEFVYGYLAAAKGPQQGQRIRQHLIGLNQIIDARLTEYDEPEVIESLVRYLMIQRRLDFRRDQKARRNQLSTIEESVDLPLLNRWLKQELDQGAANFGISCGVVEHSKSSLVRQYAQLHGVEIPYRSEQRYGGKERGVVAAVDLLLSESRDPRLILIISDLSGIIDANKVKRVLQLALKKHHKVVILVPQTHRYYEGFEDQGGPTQAAVFEVFGREEQREQAQVCDFLRQSGLLVQEIGPADQIHSLLSRLGVLR